MLCFDEATHTYTYNGNVLPSVTQVIDFAYNAFENIPWAVLEQARQRGQAVHRATELWDEGTLDVGTLDDSIAPYLSAWIKFKEDVDLIICAREKITYNLKDGYAGKLDVKGVGRRLRNSCMSIFDIKSAESPIELTGLQTGAYEQAERWLRLLTGTCNRYGVYLSRNGTYRLVQYDHANDFLRFKKALRDYKESKR